MRVFVYEYLTANGLGRDPGAPDHGMYREGRAMRDALVADFARLRGAEVFAFPDDVAPVGRTQFLREASRADWCAVVAPELDGTLADLAAAVPACSRLLGCAPVAIRLASDKFALADHWRASGVRTPATSDRAPTLCESFPVVWKPRDGAGSTDTFLIRDRFELSAALAARDPDRAMILQEFVPGRAASVALLCGPRERLPLVPAFQVLSADGRFKYEGGELPMPPSLAERAVCLARAAVASVPGLMGYVGVDLVLGDASDGSADYAIEINPRLTTSYLGLRALAAFNIAEAMLKVAAGEPVGPLAWRSGPVRFGPDGFVA
ncbi:MAG: ATP-grasp domain-containing protein [Gemmata sp.]